MDVPNARRLRELESENAKLKRLLVANFYLFPLACYHVGLKSYLFLVQYDEGLALDLWATSKC